eukprot:3004889-Rhodomonas_salina.2
MWPRAIVADNAHRFAALSLPTVAGAVRSALLPASAQAFTTASPLLQPGSPRIGLTLVRHVRQLRTVDAWWELRIAAERRTPLAA